MKDKGANGNAVRTIKTGGQDIRIINVAAISFAVVSWFATAQGLDEYVFDSVWQSALVSFGIQGILFVLNLKLPGRFHELGETHLEETRKSFLSKVHIFFIRLIFVLFYSLVIVSSNLFSFVYICDQVVYHHQSGYTDDNTLLSSLYSQLLQQTEEYIEEETQAVQMLASFQLSDLLAENPQILGTQNGSSFRTEKNIDNEIKQVQNELKKKLVDEQTAQDNYKNVQSDYEALYGERFWRPDEFTSLQELRDKKRGELNIVSNEVTYLENRISDLEKEKIDLANSPITKTPSF